MIEIKPASAGSEPADSDRTVLVPRPGGRRLLPDAGAAPASAAENADATSTVAAVTAAVGSADVSSAGAGSAGVDSVGAGSAGANSAGAGSAGAGSAGAAINTLRRQGDGLNPLVRSANPLLDLVVPLRYLMTETDVDELRQNLVRAIRNFETEAKAQNIESQSIAVARYALCTFLDETIANTPSGSGGAWASKSLLVAFHNEAWGGEKFFIILQRLAQEPARHLHLLELMYLCLALGFEGRYRVLDSGRDKLEGLRERLQKMIASQRGVPATALSLHWEPSTAKPDSLFKDMPLWGTAIVVTVLMMAVHIGLGITLSHASDPVLDKLQQLHVVSAASAPAEVAPLSLVALLAPEIAHGLVSVSDAPGQVKITLRGDGVFASGSAEVAMIHKPLLDRIGDALKQVEGNVLVIGHTDNVPYASPRFNSNDELSRARADAVRTLLEQATGKPQRYRVEGHGASDPLVANDTAANRARNRRVDIVLSTSGNSENLTQSRHDRTPAKLEQRP